MKEKNILIDIWWTTLNYKYVDAWHVRRCQCIPNKIIDKCDDHLQISETLFKKLKQIETQYDKIRDQLIENQVKGFVNQFEFEGQIVEIIKEENHE